jgi:hypothetical protein
MSFALSNPHVLPADSATDSALIRTAMIIPLELAVALAVATIFFAFIAALAAD